MSRGEKKEDLTPVLCCCLLPFVVIPEGDLLLSFGLVNYFFAKNLSKIACQAPKPPKPNK
jgi:hypothetical protein